MHSCPATDETVSAESSRANTPNSIDAIDLPPPVAMNNMCQQALSNSSLPKTFSPNFVMIGCDDLLRAADFYYWCFGWIFISDFSQMHLPKSVYLLPYGNRPLGFLVDKKAPDVTLGALFLRRESLPLDNKKKPRRRREHAMSYFPVDDIEHTSGLIQRRKGKVYELRMGAELGGMDIGEFEDTEGNLFGIMTVRQDEADVSGRNASTA